MADRIHRITMFKIPDKEDQARMIAQYETLAATQQKDGKPFILSMVVGPAEQDSKSQGYTIVAKTEFATLDDMNYYDTECTAHLSLKAFAAKNLRHAGPPLTVFFAPKAVSVL